MAGVPKGMFANVLRCCARNVVMSVRRDVAVVWGVGLRSVSVWKRQFPSPGTSTVWCGSSPVRKSFWVLWFSEKLLHCSMGGLMCLGGGKGVCCVVDMGV